MNCMQHDLPDDNLTAMSRFLLWRVDGLGLLDIGPEAVDEITQAVAKCRRLVDRPADRQYAGMCGGQVEGIECTHELYGTVGARQMTCPDCGTTWDLEERRTWLLSEAEDRLAPANEVSRAVSWWGAQPLTAERIRTWKKRNQILVKGHDRDGNPLYRIGDAIELLAASTRKEAS